MAGVRLRKADLEKAQRSHSAGLSTRSPRGRKSPGRKSPRGRPRSSPRGGGRLDWGALQPGEHGHKQKRTPRSQKQEDGDQWVVCGILDAPLSPSKAEIARAGKEEIFVQFQTMTEPPPPRTREQQAKYDDYLYRAHGFCSKIKRKSQKLHLLTKENKQFAHFQEVKPPFSSKPWRANVKPNSVFPAAPFAPPNRVRALRTPPGPAVTLKNVLKACETETVRRKKLEAQVAELERLVREGALNRRRSTVHEGEEPPVEEPPLESPAAKLMWKKANRHAFAAARAKMFLEELQKKRAEAEALKAEESEEEPPPAVDYFAQPAKEESESSDEAPVYQSSGKKPTATWTKERHGRMKEKGKEITQDDLQTPR